MPDQFCPSCGTEVDADARFCPTCGQTLGEEADELSAGAVTGAEGGADEASPIPAAPAWPPSQPAVDEAAAAEPEPAPATEAEQAVTATAPEAPAPEPDDDDDDDDMDAGPPPIPAWRQQAPGAPAPGTPMAEDEQPTVPPSPGAPPAGPAPAGGGDELPITLPTMLSGWLIGGGSGFAALALLPRLANVLNVLIFVALLWVAATVFLADRMPPFAHQRLAILVTVMISLGVGLDRAAFTVRGVETIFLVMALLAAAGVLMIELEIDRPLPPSSGNG